MNKNTLKKDYSSVGGGLSKLSKEAAKRQGYTFKSKAQKLKEKQVSSTKEDKR